MKLYVRMRFSQRGSVLIVSLIMLVVLTLLAISAIKMSTTGLHIVNAMQTRSEAMSTAQRCVEQQLGVNFSDSIETIAGTCSLSVDNNKSYDVILARPCLKQLQTIRNSELNLTDAEDAKCYDTTTNPLSACANTIWEFGAAVNDGFFGTNVSVRQGVSVRMDYSSALAFSISVSPVYTCS